MTQSDVSFSIHRIAFDTAYQPADTTRLTTNFANLARGERRQQNLCNTLRMIDNRFNTLVHWDNPRGERYGLELNIISVDLHLSATGAEGADTAARGFPLIEILQTTILDRETGVRIDGVTGNNFSSFIRDYDFSVLLPEHQATHRDGSVPDGFGDLHGKLFRHFVQSPAYRDHFGKPPVICLSVSTSRRYHRIGNVHPTLGVEYQCDALSSTDAYFAKMGLKARYFMPQGSAAPLAFYHSGDLLSAYSNLELASTISTMESFQRIYRPEIYNANAAATQSYQPSLKHQDYSHTQIIYDREERSQLAVQQGRFTQTHLMTPHRATLAQWSANFPV